MAPVNSEKKREKKRGGEREEEKERLFKCLTMRLPMVRMRPVAQLTHRP